MRKVVRIVSIFVVSLVLIIGLGLFLNFTSNAGNRSLNCKKFTITDTLGTTHLETQANGERACIEVTTEISGVFELEFGRAITAPIFRDEFLWDWLPNGDHMLIRPFTQTLKPGEAISVSATPDNDSKAKLDLWINFGKEEGPDPEPEEYFVFLPLVATEEEDPTPPPLWDEYIFDGEPTVCLSQWEDVLPEQKTCVRVTATEQGDALLDTGQTSERDLEAWLNGIPIELETRPVEPDMRIQQKSLPDMKVLEVCLDEGTTYRWIGLHIVPPSYDPD